MANRQLELMAMNENAKEKSYRFFLVTATGGIVPIIVQIDDAPDGWKDEITIKRSKKYKGFFRSYSTNELKFVKAARETIKNIYEAKGLAADSYLFVQKYNTATFEYDDHYTGKLDFTTYEIDELAVSIQVLDTNLAESIKNRENIEVNIYEDKTVDGTVLSAINTLFKEFVFPETNVSTRAEYTGNDYSFGGSVVGPTFIREEIQLDLGFSQIDEAETQTKETNDYFYRTAPDDRTMKVTGSIKGRVTAEIAAGGSYQISFKVKDASNNTMGTLKTYSGITTAAFNWYDFEFAAEATAWFALSTGNSLKLVAEIDVSGWLYSPDGAFMFEIETSDFLLEDQFFNLPQQATSGMQFYETMYQVLRKITGNIDPLYSEYFGRTDSTGHAYARDGQLGVFAKGSLIRGLDQNLDVNFSLNWEDLFDTLDAAFNIGMGIEQIGGLYKARIESYEHFFDENVVLDLSERISTEQIAKKVLPEWHYSQIKAGYKKFENEIENAIFEFNSKQTYATKISSLISRQNTLDIVAKFRADTNGINILRDAYGTDDSENIKGDDEIFMIDVIRGALSTFKARTDDGFAEISGGVSGSENYNYLLTPKRCLLRHGANIRAGLELVGLNTWLTFQAGDSLVNLKTRLTTETTAITEMTDIRVNELDEPRWKPEAYKFKCPFYTDDLRTLEANMNGLIKIAENKYGWILEIKTDIENEAEIELLRVNLDYITPIELP